MGRAPVLIVSPHDDPAFLGLANLFIAEGADSPSKLQALLRERYPKAVVRLRELSSEPDVVWYLYRDGRWIRTGGHVRRLIH